MNQLGHIVNNFKCVTPLVVFSISVRFYFIQWMSSVEFEKHPHPMMLVDVQNEQSWSLDNAYAFLCVQTFDWQTSRSS